MRVLTIVFGNVAVKLASTNALWLLQLAGRANIPPSKAPPTPWPASSTEGPPLCTATTGSTQAVAQPAAELLAEVVSSHPGQVTLVALGPHTNLAHALRLWPSLVNEVAEVVVMGGNAFCAGNATPAAEANVLSDPDAADEV